MTGGELVLLIVAIGGLVTGVIGAVVAALTARSSAKKGELEALCATVETLQLENARLITRVKCLEDELEDRNKRIDILERSLRDQTKARADREMRIRELEDSNKRLETEIDSLRSKVQKLENGATGIKP